MKKTRREAAKELAAEWWARSKDWWARAAAGGPKEQTAMWLCAVGIPSAAIGSAVWPRATALALAALWIWKKIEDKR